jgi:hypothetical protein
MMIDFANEVLQPALDRIDRVALLHHMSDQFRASADFYDKQAAGE